MDTNILVIGSGISGLTYAIKMAEQNPSLEIVMISKNSLLESNTRYAQGGIAVVSNFQKDSFDKHVEDTLTREVIHQLRCVHAHVIGAVRQGK